MKMPDETAIRQEAIHRFVIGEKPKSIYTSLSRSKPWFYKWLKLTNYCNSEPLKFRPPPWGRGFRVNDLLLLISCNELVNDLLLFNNYFENVLSHLA